MHPQTKALIELQYQTLDVLKIEGGGKVAVIRKHEE